MFRGIEGKRVGCPTFDDAVADNEPTPPLTVRMTFIMLLQPECYRTPISPSDIWYTSSSCDRTFRSCVAMMTQ